jgi:Na+/H+-translocating membrane pyrophosphatase
MLDSLGNTTAATGKGFAIGSAALTAMALLAAYAIVVKSSVVDKLTVEDASAVAAHVDHSNTTTFAKSQGLEGSGDHTLYLTYKGHGEFKMVAESGEHVARGGGLLLASNAVAEGVENLFVDGGTVKAEAHWDALAGEYDVSVNGVNFDLVPADKASLKHMAAFYDISIMNPRVLGGIFLGVMLAFVFCAMTMNAVGRAAYQMMNECRRQFGLMRNKFKADGMSEADVADPMKWPKQVNINGKDYPDYQECVSISTAGAQREMVIPSIMAIVTPIIVGLILGIGGVMGLLVGGLTSGFALAIYMANAGGAWDNAKKYIEAGHHGGKGSDAHKASVTGDTVGDPFKDTSGPSLNILIKLIAIVSVVFAGLVVHFGPTVQAAIGLG